MRLLLCLALLVPQATAQNRLAHVAEYPLPSGLPDGSLMTFYFWHKGDHNTPESVVINFYDVPQVDIDQVYDVSAHLRIDRTTDHPVKSASFIDGEWRGHVDKEQPLDEEPPSKGWWRVDVYKHDKYRMNVFFQGFWSDIRTFGKSLHDLKVIYIISDNVDLNYCEIRIKTPNNMIAPMSAETFMDIAYSTQPRTLISFPALPVGSHIEMSAMLRASGGRKYDRPMLVFMPSDKDNFLRFPFFAIGQVRESEGHEALMIGYGETKCTNEVPNGDLQHLHVERIGESIVRVRVFYKASSASGVACDYTQPTIAAFNRPFDIVSSDGALIFHLSHSISRDVETAKDRKK